MRKTPGDARSKQRLEDHREARHGRDVMPETTPAITSVWLERSTRGPATLIHNERDVLGQ
jgi:hypothetical protein